MFHLYFLFSWTFLIKYEFFYGVSSIFSFYVHKFFFLQTFISYPFPLKNELSSRTIEQRAKLRDKLKVTNRITKSSFYLNSTEKISHGIRSSNRYFIHGSRSRNFSPILPVRSISFYRTLAIYFRITKLSSILVPHFFQIPERRRKKKRFFLLLTVKYKSCYLQNTSWFLSTLLSF